MGRIFILELEGRAYSCRFCKTQLALASDLISRGFHSRRGKAYLFHKACGQIVGWKYEAAHDKSQRYKEGKFVLERVSIVDGAGAEFYIDNRPGSDSDEA